MNMGAPDIIRTERLVDAFLEDQHADIDADLPAFMQLMAERRAGRSWHKHGSFKDHLYSTYRMLTLWGQPRDACLCGLLHSVYSNEYVDLALFDPVEGRDVLREKLGREQEAMIHLFCEMPRNVFVTELARPGAATPRDGMALRDGAGAVTQLTREQVAKYLVITVADLVEQWYSWQEDTMSGYPYTGQVESAPAWAATLWPGPFRPGSSSLSLASRLARHLPALGLPVPPIFDECTAVLAEADEAAAAALYWQAMNADVPLVSPAVARSLLEQSIRLNPWVGEPRLLLAQIALLEKDFDAAATHAEAGLRLLRGWGVQWDKRVTWSGWMIWARLLRQNARERKWPATLRLHNNLGLVRG
jgi:hypothetical protein